MLEIQGGLFHFDFLTKYTRKVNGVLFLSVKRYMEINVH